MENRNEFQAPQEINGWRTIGLGVGGVFSLIILAIAVLSPGMREQALRSWLLGYIFWGGIGFGCLGVLILQYLTGGAWGVVTRRILEAGARTLPVLAVLFIPIAVGVTSLYEWTHLPNDEIIKHRQPYLSVEWFIIRSVLYFIMWGAMVYFLNKWSQRQDEAGDYETQLKMAQDASKFSGPTMVFFVLVVSFAAIDWVMTLDPHWFSTMWGFLFVAGWGLSCFCFVVAVLAYLSDKAPMNRIVGKRHFHDLGKLMLALVMVWAYFNFSQFLIIWSGNIPEETTWYLRRQHGGWGVLGIVLVLFHFAFPFLVLLTREVKMKPKWLALLAIFILVLRLVDMFFLISPNPRIAVPEQELGLLQSFSWMDIVAPIGIGGIWLWAFFGELLKRPLVPVNDPYLPNAIEHGKGH